MGSAGAGVFVAWSDTRLATADTQAQDIFGAGIEVGGDGGPSSRALLIAAEVALIVAGLVLFALVARNRRKSVPSRG